MTGEAELRSFLHHCCRHHAGALPAPPAPPQNILCIIPVQESTWEKQNPLQGWAGGAQSGLCDAAGGLGAQVLHSPGPARCGVPGTALPQQ